MDQLNGKPSETFGANERPRLPERLAAKLAAIKEASLARKAALAKKEAAKENVPERRLPERRLPEKLGAKHQVVQGPPHAFYIICGANLEKRAALLREMDAVHAIRQRKEPEVTFEFEDAGGSMGGIVAGDPTDPKVIAAAQAAICCFNEYKLVTGVRKGPEIALITMIMDTNLCNSIATGCLTIVSIKKVNVESLEPEVPTVFYYITLICKDDHGNDAEYQLKVFSSPSYYVKIFRRAPSMDMVNVSEPSSYQPLSQELKQMILVEA